MPLLLYLFWSIAIICNCTNKKIFPFMGKFYVQTLFIHPFVWNIQTKNRSATNSGSLLATNHLQVSYRSVIGTSVYEIPFDHLNQHAGTYKKRASDENIKTVAPWSRRISLQLFWVAISCISNVKQDSLTLWILDFKIMTSSLKYRKFFYCYIDFF